MGVVVVVLVVEVEVTVTVTRNLNNATLHTFVSSYCKVIF